MTAAQSFLSSGAYQYDFVVATTQRSINTAMKSFLSGLTDPAVTVCFIANANGDPAPIDHAELIRITSGVDPFAISADANPTTDPRIRNLLQARFMAGFRARLGLPAGVRDANSVPDFVEIGADTASVTFNMMCSEFTIVELIPGGGWSDAPVWTQEQQQPGVPWIFQSKVDLRLALVERGAFALLPDAVRREVMSLDGDAFSIRQLLFDFTSAGLTAQKPRMDGTKLTTKVRTLLEQYFLGAYFNALQAQGQPVLGSSVSRNSVSLSTLTLTDLNFMVNPYYGTNRQPILQPVREQAELATLNYLCAADGRPLPRAVRFDWNWIDTNEPRDYDGAVVVNRVSFANYFRNQLQHYVERNCLRPGTRVWLSGFLDTDVNFQSSMTPGQQPTVTMPASGETVLSFVYSAEAFDQAGLNGSMGSERLRTSFNLDVRFRGNTILIVQRLVIYMEGTGLFGIRSAGNIVDKAITDTYTLGIAGNGDLSASLYTGREDRSQNPSQDEFVNFWSGDINKITNDVANWVRDFTSHGFDPVPLSVIRQFVFPGGRSFRFRTAGFSDHQDLVAYISFPN